VKKPLMRSYRHCQTGLFLPFYQADNMQLSKKSVAT